MGVKVVVAGGGSIGTVIGMLLQAQGNEIYLIRRNPPFGKIPITMVGVKEMTLEMEIIRAENAPDADLFIITTQAQQTRGLLKEINLPSTSTPFLSLQNGIDTANILCKMIDHPIYLGSVWWSATLQDAHHVLFHREASTSIGIPSCSRGTKEELRNIVSILGEVIDCNMTQEIESELRKKLLLNVVSPVLALLKEPYPQGLRIKEGRELVHVLFDEAYLLAKQKGWKIDDDPRLLEFHQLLREGESEDYEVDETKNNEATHKVSTQISMEKHGGKGSNVDVLLNHFEGESKVIREFKKFVEEFPASYEAINPEKLQQFINMRNNPCPLSKNN